MSGRRKPAPLGDDPQFRLSDAQAIDAAHRAIVEATVLRAAPALRNSPVGNLARAAHALAQLASSSTGTLHNHAACGAMECQAKAALTPSGCMDDVASKLALLVANLNRGEGPCSIESRLAVSALVDVVLLRDGEATLPPGALDPVVDRVDAEHWLRQAEVQR